MICVEIDNLVPCLKDASTGDILETEVFHGAEPICMLHEYQIGIFDEAARKIREFYDYEWTDDEI